MASNDEGTAPAPADALTVIFKPAELDLLAWLAQEFDPAWGPAELIGLFVSDLCCPDAESRELNDFLLSCSAFDWYRDRLQARGTDRNLSAGSTAALWHRWQERQE